ncbi:MAG: hypothetical protein U0325_21315 [Polyangiales bacterium]
MNKSCLAILALALLATTGRASAQTVIVAPWSAPTVVLLPPPPPEMVTPSDLAASDPADASRLRFGIAGNLTVGLANDHGHGVHTGVFAPGLTLDLGVQMNRRVALFVRAAASSLIVMNHAAVLGVAEYSPAPWLSLGTGLGWTGIASAFGNSVDACCGGISRRSDWGALAVPAVVGFNLGSRNPVSGRFQGMRVDLSGALGLEPGSGALGWYASLALGYVTM